MTKFILSLAILISSYLTAQNSYNDKMQMALQNYNSGNLDEAITLFDEVSKENSDNWLPFYYISYLNTSKAFVEKDAKTVEVLLKKAQNAQDVCNELQPDNAEVMVAQALLHTAKIKSNPMVYGQMLYKDVLYIYDKAMQKDKNNPRVVLCKAEFEIGLADYMGGNKQPMYDAIKNSIELFANFKPETPFHPNWGLEQAKQTLENYNN